MSEEKESQQERRDSSLTAEDGGNVSMWPASNGDNDSTPRSEVPPQTLRSRLPVRREDGSTVTGMPIDYFAIPTSTEMQVMSDVHAPSAISTTSSTASASSVTATGHIAPQTDAASAMGDLRPPPQTQTSSLSIESVDSATTVLAPLARPRTQQPYPVFPNQSYAALHHQQYPQPYTPPLHRQRSAHLGNILTFTSALASTHHTGARTAGNSPAPITNTGLFDPHSARNPGGFEPSGSHGTYSSPFLHFTHRQAPKETHVADVDVDTMSGRKVINHYEIVDELGRGTHGKVKLGRDLDTKDTFVAIKIVERYSKRRKLGKLGEPEDKVKKEVAILKKARHPNIVALLEVIDDPKRKKVYIVLELVERGEIMWRIKSPFKEVAILEARRYERERSGKNDPRADAEDEAIRAEATCRLAKKKRHAIRKFRQTRRNAPDDTMVFSHEMVGDQESGDDEDDRLSRISSTTADSLSKKPHLPESRLPSRPETPMMSSLDSRTPTPDTPEFLSLTAEPEPILDRAPRQKSSRFYTGLEGTMYGAYDASSTESSRPGSVNGSRKSTEDLVKLAN
ncbi:MAG: protein kinase, partial [Terriglobus roseus]|nr:protein kinase [Terriglobus roseus]